MGCFPDRQIAAGNQALKPFLPGYYVNTRNGYLSSRKSLATPDKTAGVDALGMLAGSISMTSFFKGARNAANEQTAMNLDKYYRMNQAEVVAGLDARETPGY